MPREQSQETGRAGVAVVKRWLEATTFLDFPHNSYHADFACRATCLDGTTKIFDLAGHFLVPPAEPVFVEVKSVTTDAHLREQFEQFVAIAYSATAHHLENFGDERRHYMWASWHPFGPMAKWAHLTTPAEIREALAHNEALLAGREPDEDLVRLVADRLWVLTFNPKQEQLSLKPQEILEVRAALKRTGSLL